MNRGQGLEFLNFENLPSFKGRGIILKYLCFIYCCVYRRRCLVMDFKNQNCSDSEFSHAE